MSGGCSVACAKCGRAEEFVAPVCARMDCPQAAALARASSKLFAAVPKRPESLFTPDLSRLVVGPQKK